MQPGSKAELCFWPFGVSGAPCHDRPPPLVLELACAHTSRSGPCVSSEVSLRAQAKRAIRVPLLAARVTQHVQCPCPGLEHHAIGECLRAMDGPGATVPNTRGFGEEPAAVEHNPSPRLAGQPSMHRIPLQAGTRRRALCAFGQADMHRLACAQLYARRYEKSRSSPRGRYAGQAHSLVYRYRGRYVRRECLHPGLLQVPYSPCNWFVKHHAAGFALARGFRHLLALLGGGDLQEIGRNHYGHNYMSHNYMGHSHMGNKYIGTFKTSISACFSAIWALMGSILAADSCSHHRRNQGQLFERIQKRRMGCSKSRHSAQTHAGHAGEGVPDLSQRRRVRRPWPDWPPPSARTRLCPTVKRGFEFCSARLCVFDKSS